jgi:hypothetical protein
VASRVLVPIATDPVDGTTPNDVALSTAEMMARIAHLGPFDVIPLHLEEPIALNAAVQIKRFLEGEHIRSVVVVSPLFRSRRSSIVYQLAFGPAGVAVRCEPARSPHGIDIWARSWHGVEIVAEQWIKLQYYRLFVLPFHGAL